MAKKNVITDPLMDKLVSLCKRRGFVFQSSEIYGGLGSCWDYGPLGVELKNNVKRIWWETMTHRRDDIEGVDAAILMAPQVWQASGHIDGFTDPLVDCKKCHHRFRADQIETKVCPDCGGELTEPRNFNLMFKTFMGPVEDDAAVVYLRPETAQGIYVNFLMCRGHRGKKYLSASRKSAKHSAMKSLPAILFFEPANLSRWKCSSLSSPRRTPSGSNTGVSKDGNGISNWASVLKN
jgi:glycyl-tRNA synthetase